MDKNSPPGKRVHKFSADLNLAIPPEMLDRVQRFAAERGVSRAEAVRQLLAIGLRAATGDTRAAS